MEATIITKVGLWGVSSQFLSMVGHVSMKQARFDSHLDKIPVVISPWNHSPKIADGTARPTPHLISVLLFSVLSLSGFGNLIFELVVQEIQQIEVPPSQRSTFSGTEQSSESFALLCHWDATTVWSQPEDFRWLAIGSLTFLGTGAGTYAVGLKKFGPTYDEVQYDGMAMDNVSHGVERHS